MCGVSDRHLTWVWIDSCWQAPPFTPLTVLTHAWHLQTVQARQTELIDLPVSREH